MIPFAPGFFKPLIADSQYTKILLHFDGDDGSTTFVDEIAKTWTGQTGAEIDTAQSVFGGSSLYTSSTGGIQTADTEFLEPLDQQWTIEFFVRFASFSGDAVLFTKRATTAGHPTLQLTVGSTGNAGLYGSTNGTSTTTYGTVAAAFTTGVWYHVAVEYKPPYVTMFIDGGNVIAANQGGSITLNDNSAPWTIGADCDGTSPLRGWIDEFRYTLGIARYGGTLGSITVPTDPFVVD